MVEASYGNKIDKLGKMIWPQFPTQVYITNMDWIG